MKRGLHVTAVVSLMALAAAGCSGEAPPPAGPEFEAEPPVVEDGEQEAQESQTLMEALSTFGACLSLEAWMRSGMYMLYLAQTDQNQECQGCHADGTGGQVLSVDIVDTFDAHTQFPAIMRLVTGQVDDRGVFLDLVESNRYINKGIESCPPLESGLPCHPSYNLIDVNEKAVTSFVAFSLKAWRDNDCTAQYVVEE